MFVPLSSNKIVNKQLTQFFERTHSIWRYLAKPHSCWPFEGGRECLTHDLVWNPLKVHCSLKSSDMIKRIVHSIIWVQERHLELRRQGMTIDGSREKRVYSMNLIIYEIRPSHVLLHFIHGLPHLIHFLLQVWHLSWSDTPWQVLELNIISFSNFLTLGLSFCVSFIALPP